MSTILFAIGDFIGHFANEFVTLRLQDSGLKVHSTIQGSIYKTRVVKP
jgi:hypothetical protein